MMTSPSPRRRFVSCCSLLGAGFLLALSACSPSRPPPAAAPSAHAAETEAPRAPAETVIPGSTAIPEDAAASLPPEVRNAAQTLASAEAFGGDAVGYSGQPTDEVAALRSLIDGQHSEALQLVIEHGSLPAQLMALSGLYFADHAAFEHQVVNYRDRPESVPVLRGGCMMGHDAIAIAELIRKPDAMELGGPTETLETWSQRNPPPQTMILDIEGGGYPLILAGR